MSRRISAAPCGGRGTATPSSRRESSRAVPTSSSRRSSRPAAAHPHIHHREEESFYLLEGTLTATAGDRTVTAGPGDFVHFPAGRRTPTRTAGMCRCKMIATFAPAGMEGWFLAALVPALDRDATPPPPTPTMLEADDRLGTEVRGGVGRAGGDGG